jgi:hypothetical protein
MKILCADAGGVATSSEATKELAGSEGEAEIQVPSAKRILTAFMPLRRGPAVTQTTNFRD